MGVSTQPLALNYELMSSKTLITRFMQFSTVMSKTFIATLTIFLLTTEIAVSKEHTGLTGTIEGVVLDYETREPVTFAYLHLEEINRTTTTDRNGYFRLRNVPSGNYTLIIHRIGYMSLNQTITVEGDEVSELVLEMRSTVLSGDAIQVVADAEQTIGSGLEHASVKIIGDKLRRNLDATLSSTLSNEPGISERSMGVAPGRPVIRGLGDERVLILEDGQRTGDVSWTTSDHSVTVDPSSAEEIQIARGPAALEHGSGAIGGVINVVRNQIPNSVPTSTTGSISLQGASVNRGAMAAGNLMIPWRDDFVLNLDLNGRIGHDYETPAGRLDNSYLQTTSNSFGLSHIRSWGYAGLSGSMYMSHYGIPPDPLGGHPGGVDIEMTKYQTEARTEILLGSSLFDLLEVRGSFIRYNHAEIESSGVIGTEYDMDTTTGSIKLRNKEWGIFSDGVIGAWGEYVDYSVFGTTGNPDSRAWSGSLFAIQEADIGHLHLEAGLRFNHVSSRPQQERISGIIGNVRNRNFTGLESSISAIYDFGRGFHLGTTLMHSWRAPSLEELYSEGPHLAAYAFEVGNPDLKPERGLGTELFGRYKHDRATLELTGYYNFFRNYIHSQNTGEMRPPRADLFTYQFVDTRASIYGAELSAEYQLVRNLVVDGSLSLTIGDRNVSEEEKEITGLTESEQPLPMIPPFKGNLGLRYTFNSFTIGGRARLSAKQDRLGEFETPTDEYAVIDLNLQYRFNWGTTLHTVSLNALNLFNEEYYNHLSKIKDLFPEPGRSVNLLYRVYF
jgi:iron complex outermembrane recepter protein